MRSSRGIGLVLIATLGLFGATFAAAYAYGTQNHTVNDVRHGCPYDPGCTGTTSADRIGNYERNGYNRCGDPFPACPGDGDMDYSRVRVRYYPTDTFITGNNCYNCGRVDVYADTNPNPECKYKTVHYVEGPALSLHDHYTESALC